MNGKREEGENIGATTCGLLSFFLSLSLPPYEEEEEEALSSHSVWPDFALFDLTGTSHARQTPATLALFPSSLSPEAEE